MSRKDFEAMAAALRSVKPFPPRESNDELRGWELACTAVANVFETANPRFDRARFLAACGGAS